MPLGTGNANRGEMSGRKEDPKNAEPCMDARLAEAGARGALRGTLAGGAGLCRAAGAAGEGRLPSRGQPAEDRQGMKRDFH